MATATRIEVLDPTSDHIPASAVIAPRPSTLEGATIGLLSNGKVYAAGFLEMVGEVLADRYQFGGVVAMNKGNASRPAPKEMLDELAERCDAVITASGDWGSCSSCSVHDAIEMEKRGVPAVAICTEPFISSAKAMSKLGGIPDYPFVILPHPMAHLSGEELRDYAVRAAPDTLRILLAKG